MPVRLQITLLFGAIVFLILALVCGTVYYVSYNNRKNGITTRLTNRAITTARLLRQSDYFTTQLMQRIDAATALTLKDKVIEVYDYLNNKIYRYADNPADTAQVEKTILDNARVRNNIYFTMGPKDAIAHHHVDSTSRFVVISAAFDEDGLARLKQLRVILWSSFFGGIVVAFIAGYFFSGGLLMPVKKIADDINEISARNLARRIHTGKIRDEWYYLSNTLNHLLNRLQESFEMQQRFIANASHELSTPLTSISSQLEISLQKHRDATKYRQVMESVYQDVLHLNKLTQTLLEFAQASGTEGGIHIQLLRIDEILMLLPAEMKKTNSHYSVQLNFEALPVEEEKLLVSGNAELLLSAIKNIVSNACKYADDHRAFVQLIPQEQQVAIIVKDNGPGIPENELDNIFQPFYRSDATKSVSGFGLGLSLCNRIIKLHNGQLSVASQVDVGSTFTITLPVTNSNRFLIHH